MQHDFYQMRVIDRPLQQKDVIIGPKIHGLRDDAIFGKWLSADRFPPEILPTEPGDRFPRNVSFHHVS
jgi:hypothetical protein